jgi:hypothetical protein
MARCNEKMRMQNWTRKGNKFIAWTMFQSEDMSLLPKGLVNKHIDIDPRFRALAKLRRKQRMSEG